MLKLKKVAVTGGIGCGKTTICDILKEAGAYVVNSDEVAHDLLEVDSLLGKKIIKFFGSEIITNGDFDRGKIAERVFNDPNGLHYLESLLHPVMLREIEKRYEQAKKRKFRLFVVEMPLLFELHQEKMFDIIITVYAKKSLCMQRLSPQKRKDINKRMQRQCSIVEKKRRADVVIINNGTKEELKKKVSEFLLRSIS